jgi:hypothetical protein
MESIPNEIVLVIFEYIRGITNKRRFIRTCKTYNKFIIMKHLKIYLLVLLQINIQMNYSNIKLKMLLLWKNLL